MKYFYQNKNSKIISRVLRDPTPFADKNHLVLLAIKDKYTIKDIFPLVLNEYELKERYNKIRIVCKLKKI